MVLIDEGVQTEGFDRKVAEKLTEHAGLKILKERKENDWRKKLKEQQEVREMLEKYWPWSQQGSVKPRGLRNLKLEGLYPDKDFQNAKRLVGGLNFGKPGGGAPIVTKSGRNKAGRFREDPNLRFQWGMDLRKHVDNRIRYQTHKDEQEKYKKELDKLVEEKSARERKEKFEDMEFARQQFLRTPPWGKPGPGGASWRNPRAIGLDFLKSMGWSNEKTLKFLDEERAKYKEKIRSEYKKFKRMQLRKPNQISKLEDQNEVDGDAMEAENFELVPILAKGHKFPKKIQLTSTDVTRKANVNSKLELERPAYLEDLSNQMKYRLDKIKELKQQEMNLIKRHFSTLDSFWGRPGNGAPSSTTKKRQLERLLYYPQLIRS